VDSWIEKLWVYNFCQNYVTPRCKVFFEKLTVAQLVKKFPAFCGTRSSLPCSQKLSTGPSPEPFEFSPLHSGLKIHFNRILSYTPKLSKFFLEVFQLKFCMNFSYVRATLPAQSQRPWFNCNTICCAENKLWSCFLFDFLFFSSGPSALCFQTSCRYLKFSFEE
jgi:hypothetical protein